MTCRRGYPVMYKSKKAKAWIEQATWELYSQQKKKRIDADIILYVTVYKKRTTDIDNFMKATMDLLETAGVIKNDKQVAELHVYRNKAGKGEKEYMEVQIETWEE